MSVEVSCMTWGLIPSHEKLRPEVRPDFFRLMNARSETAAQLNSFRKLCRMRRCAVVLDGWYEWKEDYMKQKQPWYVFLASSGGSGGGGSGGGGDGSTEGGRPLILAALYDVNKGSGEEGAPMERADCWPTPGATGAQASAPRVDEGSNSRANARSS